MLALSLSRAFDYQVAPNQPVLPGTRVLVDFRGKERVGIIYSLALKTEFSRLKTIKEPLDSKPCLGEAHLKMAAELSNCYLYPESDFLFSMLPAYLREKNKLNQTNGCRQQKTETQKQIPLFIKSDFLLTRYQLWKENVKTALRNGSAVICLPQITQLEKISELLKQEFGNKVYEFHSRQSPKKSFLNWQKSREKAILVGTRSALFFFPSDTRIIIVEEEASPHYFQETKPFYHLRKAAFFLSALKNCRLILAGDYPSLYSYAQIKKQKIKLIELDSRKKEIKLIANNNFTKYKHINPVFTELIRKTIWEKKQAAVIWNKKNFWRAIYCTLCQTPLKCPRCSGPLQQEKEIPSQLICPYCQEKIPQAAKCPSCQNNSFKGRGMGIEKLKTMLKKFFPETTIGDLTELKTLPQITVATAKILNLAYQEKIFDRGFMLDADSRLNTFDFDAGFNLYCYLKKISLLFKENLFVFSSHPGYYVFSYLDKCWREFYEKELSLRCQLDLPPVKKIIKLVVRSKDKEEALKAGKRIYNMLEKESQAIFGPFKETPHKLREKYRYGLVIKAKKNFCPKTLYSQIHSFKQRKVQAAIIVR